MNRSISSLLHGSGAMITLWLIGRAFVPRRPVRIMIVPRNTFLELPCSVISWRKGCPCSAILSRKPGPGAFDPAEDLIMDSRDLQLPGLRLGGTLRVPSSPKGLILFAHGSGSSRFSPRNTAVAARLNEADFATLLIDLL